MANRERLLKALHEIELAEALRLEQPEVNLELHWKQWAWAVKTDVHSTGRGSMIMDCGTGMCVAGWGCHLAGDTFVWALDQGTEAEEVMVDGRRMPISQRARELYDLTPYQAEMLFAGSNDLGQIRTIIAKLLAAEEDV